MHVDWILEDLEILEKEIIWRSNRLKISHSSILLMTCRSLYFSVNLFSPRNLVRLIIFRLHDLMKNQIVLTTV